MPAASGARSGTALTLRKPAEPLYRHQRLAVRSAIAAFGRGSGMWVVYLAVAYLAIGAVAGPAFVFGGMARALGGPVSISAGARLLLIPGAVLLWPLLLARWRRGGPA